MTKMPMTTSEAQQHKIAEEIYRRQELARQQRMDAWKTVWAAKNRRRNIHNAILLLICVGGAAVVGMLQYL